MNIETDAKKVDLLIFVEFSKWAFNSIDALEL